MEGHGVMSGLLGGGNSSAEPSPKSEAWALSASFFLF